MAGKRKPVPVAERAANRKRWEQELARWRASGQPLSVWAREQGLSRDALDYWKRKRQGKPGRGLTLIPVSTPLVPLAPASRAEERAPLELRLGARRLVIPPGFDGESLRRAIAVLETC
jgi:hypothetical protein